MTEIKRKVLFVCTGNSVRSQMAEGLLKALRPGQWDVQSAGVLQSYVHPLAIQVMKEIRIDISKQTSKSWDRFVNEKFNYIITLCDHAAQFCPAFGGHGKRLHWPFEDPAGSTGTTDERLVVFRRIRDGIKKKIEEFLESESSEVPDAIGSFKF